jgi:hypothetical protein
MKFLKTIWRLIKRMFRGLVIKPLIESEHKEELTRIYDEYTKAYYKEKHPYDKKTIRQTTGKNHQWRYSLWLKRWIRKPYYTTFSEI